MCKKCAGCYWKEKLKGKLALKWNFSSTTWIWHLILVNKLLYANLQTVMIFLFLHEIYPNQVEAKVKDVYIKHTVRSFGQKWEYNILTPICMLYCFPILVPKLNINPNIPHHALVVQHFGLSHHFIWSNFIKKERTCSSVNQAIYFTKNKHQSYVVRTDCWGKMLNGMNLWNTELISPIISGLYL